MRTLGEDQAVVDFSIIMEPYLESGTPFTGMEVVQAFLEHYRNVRVEGVDESLLIQWGWIHPGSYPGLEGEFIDARENSYEETFAESEVPLVALSRQLMYDSGKKFHCELQFDAESFRSVLATDWRGGVEFEELNNIDDELQCFLGAESMNQLLSNRPMNLIALVCYYG